MIQQTPTNKGIKMLGVWEWMNTRYRLWKTSSSSRHDSHWDEAFSLSFSLRVWQTWFSDGRGVCLLLYISMSALRLWLSLPDSPPSLHISIFLLPSPGIFSACANLTSLCLCHITQSAADMVAEGSLTSELEMIPTLQARVNLLPKMDSPLLSIPALTNLFETNQC